MKENLVNEYLSDGKNRYLRIETDGKNAAKYELRMLRETRPEGLLSVHPQWEGERFFLDYQVSGLVPLSEEQGPGAGNYLYAILFSLDRISSVLSEHYLRPEALLVSPEQIFLRKETGEIFFCYVPGRREPLSEGLPRLMEFFLKNAKPENERDVLMLYGLYQKSREENVTLRSLLGLKRAQNGSSDARHFPMEPEMPQAKPKNPETLPPFDAFSEDDPLFPDLSEPEEEALFVGRSVSAGKSAHAAGEESYESLREHAEKGGKPSGGTLSAKAKEKLEPFLSKLPPKVRERFFEIAVALIVVIGAVLFFVI